MKKLIFSLIAVLILLSACGNEAPEPDRCALCDNLSHHAPCIINLNTGELLELDVYEPHPFLVGEIAEEQRCGYFSFVRGAGVEGYKLGAESVTITIPIKTEKLDQKHFCSSCRKLLTDYSKQGYALVDLKDNQVPVLYPISTDLKVSLRCYEISVKEIREDGKYEIIIIGMLNDTESLETN